MRIELLPKDHNGNSGQTLRPHLVRLTRNSLVVLVVVSASVVVGIDVAREMEQNEEAAPTAVVVSAQSDSSLRTEPHSYRIETPEQQTAWNSALKLCTPVPSGSRMYLDSSCHSALSNYFMIKPVWDFTDLSYYELGRLRKLPPSPLNSRHIFLPYEYEDYTLDEIPLLRDIFDGDLERRSKLFIQTASDSRCADVRLGGIQEDMAARCNARELYKYATYLSACVNAAQSLSVLRSLAAEVKYKGLTNIDASMRFIEEGISDPSTRVEAKERMERGYLYILWMVAQCVPQKYSFLPLERGESPVEYERLPLDEFKPGYIRRIMQGSKERESEDTFRILASRSHSAAMEIASRSGDEWAIRSKSLTAFDHQEYFLDVLERYPLLAHRHLGSPTGGFASELDRKDQMRHQAKTFLLLEEKAGSKIAEREYDITKLSEAIDYVLSGGALKLPRPVDEILKEMKERSQDRQRKQIMRDSSR